MGKSAETSPGLLSKVVKFINNPTTDWGNLDQLSPPDSGQSRQALKEMIERKRRNDIVRKHEFDMLRNIRHKGRRDDVLETMELTSSYTSTQLAQSYGAENSDRQDSGGNPRAQTLRKIDEIEAQLSHSWFRRGGGDTHSPSSRLALEQSMAPPSAVATSATTGARPPATAFMGEQGVRDSAPAPNFVPASLPVGAGVLGQPRLNRPPPAAPKPLYRPPPPSTPEPNQKSERPSPPNGLDLPVLTQTYQPQPDHRDSLKAALPSQPLPPGPSVAQRQTPAKPAPRPKWADSTLDGLTAYSGPGEIDLDEFTASGFKRRPSASPPAASDAPAPRLNPLLPMPGAEELRAPFAPPEMASRSPTPLGGKPRRAAAVYEDELAGSMEVLTLRNDSEIEEAAISFANGDEAAAELTLLKLVGAGGSRRQDVNAWLALFDLYRVTGKADAFDGLVSEFIALFGRSAPQWDRAESAAPLSTAPQLQVTRAGAFAWVSPSQLSDRALAALTGAVKRTAPPWRIDWRYVKAVEADVLPALGALFTQWADAPTRIQFLGGEHLLEVLAGQSTTGDKNADPAWWSVRLTLLRLMGEPDRFDQTALDYCVTYEISPPSWTPPKSNYTALAADGQPESAPADKAEELPPFVPTTVTGELLAATGVFKTALKGEIAQHATRALSALPQSLDRVQIIEFDCRALRRVDFAAAGEFLNWSLDQQSQGRTVTFRDVHRLLAAFFSVIGVNTAAQVVLRKD